MDVVPSSVFDSSLLNRRGLSDWNRIEASNGCPDQYSRISNRETKRGYRRSQLV